MEKIVNFITKNTLTFICFLSILSGISTFVWQYFLYGSNIPIICIVIVFNLFLGFYGMLINIVFSDMLSDE